MKNKIEGDAISMRTVEEDRVRRHKRTMRENKCADEDQPCWVESDVGDMCDACLMRNTSYQFRKLAVRDLGRWRRVVERLVAKLQTSVVVTGGAE